jgi:hypothetical protein
MTPTRARCVFLTDLSNVGAPAYTVRAYSDELLQFAAHHDGEIGDLLASNPMDRIDTSKTSTCAWTASTSASTARVAACGPCCRTTAAT